MAKLKYKVGDKLLYKDWTGEWFPCVIVGVTPGGWEPYRIDFQKNKRKTNTCCDVRHLASSKNEIELRKLSKFIIKEL
jgi:hypothetical protein